MQFDLVSQEILADKTNRLILRVDPEDLVYLGFILESFEGWCNYTTIRKNEPFLQVDVSPDYYKNTVELLNFLRKWEYDE